MSNSNAKFLTGAHILHAEVMSATSLIGDAGSILFFTTSFGNGIATSAVALARRVLDQRQDSQSEVQTHQAHQLRPFHLRR